MYHDVLFPTDGSDATRAALGHALDIAGQYGATLHVLTVVNEDPFRTPDGKEDATATAERTVADTAARARRDDVEVTTAVRHGTPHEEILAYADDRGVDMIVMGTHGRTGVDRALLGSITERVVRTADVPVVTVRTSDKPATVRDAESAERIALEELQKRGYASVSVSEEPYRTSGSWIVPVEGETVTAHVYVDVVSGICRIARLDERE